MTPRSPPPTPKITPVVTRSRSRERKIELSDGSSLPPSRILVKKGGQGSKNSLTNLQTNVSIIESSVNSSNFLVQTNNATQKESLDLSSISEKSLASESFEKTTENANSIDNSVHSGFSIEDTGLGFLLKTKKTVFLPHGSETANVSRKSSVTESTVNLSDIQIFANGETEFESDEETASSANLSTSEKNVTQKTVNEDSTLEIDKNTAGAAHSLSTEANLFSTINAQNFANGSSDESDKNTAGAAHSSSGKPNFDFTSGTPSPNTHDRNSADSEINCNMSLNLKDALSNISKFDGKPENLENFLAECDLHVEFGAENQADAILKVIKSKITSCARAKLGDISTKTYVELKALMKQKFKPIKTRDLAREELLCIKQKEKESIAELSTRIRDLVDAMNNFPAEYNAETARLLSEENEKTAVRRFEQAIKKESVKIALISGRCRALDEAISYALEVESRLANSDGVVQREDNKAANGNNKRQPCDHCGKTNHWSRNCRLVDGKNGNSDAANQQKSNATGANQASKQKQHFQRQQKNAFCNSNEGCEENSEVGDAEYFETDEPTTSIHFNRAGRVIPKNAARFARLSPVDLN